MAQYFQIQFTRFGWKMCVPFFKKMTKKKGKIGLALRTAVLDLKVINTKWRSKSYRTLTICPKTTAAQTPRDQQGESF